MSNIVRLNPGYFPNPTTDKSLSNASIYVGEPDTDPTIPENQKTISVLLENGTTVAVSQPLTTSAGGVPQYNGSSVTVLVDGDYSIAVLDSNDVQVFYVPSQPEALVQNVKYVDSLSGLKATSGTYDGEVVYLTGRTSINDGGQGHFVWLVGDYTTQVTADTLSGIYAPSDTDPTGAAGCWVRPVSEEIHVSWFGPIPDGATDAALAFKTSIAVYQLFVTAGNSGIWGTFNPTSGTGPTLVWPPGVYSITESLTGPDQSINYSYYKGTNTVIVPTANTIDIFGGVGYNNRISGFIFRGGSRHIVGNNNNNNSTMLDIDHCEFINAETAAIDMGDYTGMHSANVIVRNSKFRCSSAVTGTGYLFSGGSDLVVIKDCWLQTTAAIAILQREGLLRIENCTGVPENNISGPDGSVWVEVANEYPGAVLMIDRFRAGGEGGGRSTVRWTQDLYTTAPRVPSRLSIKNSEIYASTDKYICIFESLPNVVELENLSGLTTNDGLYFTNDITDQILYDFSSYGSVRVNSNDDGRVVMIPSGPNTKAADVFMSKIEGHTPGNLNLAKTEGPIPSDALVMASATQYSWTTAGDISRSSVNNAKGLPIVRFTAATAGYRYTESTTFFDPSVMTEGLYNIALHVRVTSGYWQLNMFVGPTIKQFDIGIGDYMLIVPFYYFNGTGVPDADLDRLRIYASCLSASGIDIGRIVVTSKHYSAKSETLILEGDTAPITGIFIRGDELRYNAPATAGFRGEICTVYGTPGTWKTYGAVTP